MKSGDRIGVALDMDGKSMTIFQNNKSQGRFFSPTHRWSFYPAVTFSANETILFTAAYFSVPAAVKRKVSNLHHQVVTALSTITWLRSKGSPTC